MAKARYQVGSMRTVAKPPKQAILLQMMVEIVYPEHRKQSPKYTVRLSAQLEVRAPHCAW